MLKQGYLLYYAGISDKKPKGVVPLDKCSVSVYDKRDYALAIYDAETSKDYFVCAASKIEQEQWIGTMMKFLSLLTSAKRQ